MRPLVLGTAALLLAGCTHVFYQPNDRLYSHPDAFDLEYETPRFSSLDDTPLTALWVKARTSPACGTVVHFHGNLGNLTAHFRYSAWLADYGFNVLVFDYRGYGNSGGQPTPEGVVQDGLAALRYVREREDVDPHRVVVLGQSLGGAVAVVAAARDEPGGIQAVAVEAPFSSYRSVAREKLKATWFTKIFLGPLTPLLVSDAASPFEAVGKLSPVPFLVVHGDADPVVPYVQGVRLHTAAGEPKQLWTVEGGKHIEAFTRFKDVYRPRLAAFYREALGGASPELGDLSCPAPDEPPAPVGRPLRP